MENEITSPIDIKNWLVENIRVAFYELRQNTRDEPGKYFIIFPNPEMTRKEKIETLENYYGLDGFVRIGKEMPFDHRDYDNGVFDTLRNLCQPLNEDDAEFAAYQPDYQIWLDHLMISLIISRERE